MFVPQQEVTFFLFYTLYLYLLTKTQIIILNINFQPNIKYIFFINYDKLPNSNSQKNIFILNKSHLTLYDVIVVYIIF